MKKILHLTMHSTHFSDGYMVSNIIMVKWIAGQKPAATTILTSISD